MVQQFLGGGGSLGDEVTHARAVAVMGQERGALLTLGAFSCEGQGVEGRSEVFAAQVLHDGLEADKPAAQAQGTRPQLAERFRHDQDVRLAGSRGTSPHEAQSRQPVEGLLKVCPNATGRLSGAQGHPEHGCEQRPGAGRGGSGERLGDLHPR